MFQVIQAVIATADEEVAGSNAGPIGGLFFVSMAAAAVALWWNMNSRLKRLDQKRDSETDKD